VCLDTISAQEIQQAGTELQSAVLKVFAPVYSKMTGEQAGGATSPGGDAGASAGSQ
jgi:hypothetical protein